MISFCLPLRTVSALNAREHHLKRAARVKAERNTTHFVCLVMHDKTPVVDLLLWAPSRLHPVIVTLTRVGPGALDTDNLAGALKSIRDQLAVELGVTDGPEDKRVTWRYEQEKGAYSVRVTIEEDPGF